MPATYSEGARQVNHTRDAVLANQQPDQESSNHKEDPSNDLGLTVSFLGCPSNSTRITVPTPGGLDSSQSLIGRSDDQPPITFTNTDCPSANVRSKPEVIWQENQGQNNNWCSEPRQEGDENHGNDSGRDGEGGGESPRSRETLRGREEEQVTCSSSSSVSSNESGRQNWEQANIEETSGARGHNGEDKSKRGTGFQKPGTITNSFKRAMGSKSKGSFRETKTTIQPNQEEGTAGQQTRKSAAPVVGCGRVSIPRMHRSPQRNFSPSRRKKGDHLHGSSAPVPFMPTPAQSSTGCINISRPSSVSPTRREPLAKNNGMRPSGAQDTFFKATTFRSREAPGSVDVSLTDMRRSISAKPPSPSLAASNLHRFVESVAPTQSTAESDLRDLKCGSPQADPATDPQQIQCQLILPDEPWSTGAPHGDNQQTSPHKILEMTRLALYEQQQHQAHDTQQRKRSSYYQSCNASLALQEDATGILGSVKTPASEVNVTQCDQRSNTRDKTKPTSGLDDNKTSLSYSCGSVSGSATGRPRSSRRHPVLDKMFRHILASLVMESGPPSSACLASVLDQVEGQGTSDSLRSLSRTSSVSTSNTFASRLSNSRFRGGQTCGGIGNHSAESSLADPTISLLSPLPCTLQKINEDAKTSCAAGQGEVAAAIADA